MCADGPPRPCHDNAQAQQARAHATCLAGLLVNGPACCGLARSSRSFLYSNMSSAYISMLQALCHARAPGARALRRYQRMTRCSRSSLNRRRKAWKRSPPPAARTSRSYGHAASRSSRK